MSQTKEYQNRNNSSYEVVTDPNRQCICWQEFTC